MGSHKPDPVVVAAGFAFGMGIFVGSLITAFTAAPARPDPPANAHTSLPASVEPNYSIGLNCVLDKYRAGERLFFDCREECKAAEPGEGPAAACEAGRLVGSAWAYEGFAP